MTSEKITIFPEKRLAHPKRICYNTSVIKEVNTLANIKSAKKRILVSAKRTARNKSIRSRVKTSIKRVEAAVAAKDPEAARSALSLATKDISMACSKGVYHKNNAAHKVSRLAKAVNTLG